jgi:hypothetical protein
LNITKSLSVDAVVQAYIQASIVDIPNARRAMSAGQLHAPQEELA